MSADNLPQAELFRYRGDTCALSIALYNPDTGAAFTPAVTDTFLFTVKGSATADADAAALVQKLSSAGGITLANPSIVTLVPADFGTDLLVAGVTYEWDLQCQRVDGSVKTLARGTLYFEQDSTRELTLSIATTVISPDSAYLDAVQIAEDAAQTALDRIATAADVVQTGLDRVATAADRVQTGLDRVATAADRVQTGLDRVATAAATNADAIATAADRVQTGLDRVATGADRVQTGLDVVATAADRVQTGLDRVATSADVVTTAAAVVSTQTAQTAAELAETNAETAETAAAASALTAALISAGLTFVNTVAGGSVPATSTASGYFYVIDTAGTSQSITWAVGDLAIYRGSSGSWAKVVAASALSVVMSGMLGGIRNTLAPRGGIAFDATAGSKVVNTLTSQNILTDSFAVALTLDMPTANPTTDRGLWYLASSLITNNVARACYCEFKTSGQIAVGIVGATTGDTRTMTFLNFRSDHSGKRVHLLFVRNASASTMTLYVNGVARTASSDVLTAGVDPTWAGSVTSTYLVLGNNASSIQVWDRCIYSASLYNLALSAADAFEIYELNGGVPERFKFGSQVAECITDFSSSANSFAADNFVAVGNIDADADGAGIPPSNDWLRGTTDATETLYMYNGGQAGYSPASTLRKPSVGSKFRVTYDIFVESGSTATHVVTQDFTGVSNIVTTAITPGSVTAVSVDLTSTVASTWRHSVGLNSTGTSGFTSYASGAKFYLKNFKVYRFGAVVHLPLNDGIGYQLHDDSTNKLDAVMTTTGISHVIPQRRGYVRGTLTWAGSHEAKSLIGQRALPDGAVMVLLTRDATAVSTGSGCTIGTTTTAARWQAADTYTAAKEVSTLANQLPAGTAANDHDIVVDPDTNAYTGSISVEAHYVVTEGT